MENLIAQIQMTGLLFLGGMLLLVYVNQNKHIILGWRKWRAIFSATAFLATTLGFIATLIRIWVY